jgi:predicted regulator of Ras-like GTPase activity (Roadblock/LC7/MglB family)
LLKHKTGTGITLELPSGAAEISVGVDDSEFASLSNSLAEIRKLKGVNGYILRSATSAIIDLTEQDKIIEYAILSSQISESSSEMAKQFNMNDVESVLVEGKSVKVLCLNVGENKICVFMEKAAAHAWIIKKLLL